MVANIFGSSPVQPLEKHIDIAYRCSKLLYPFFSSAFAGDWDEAEKHYNDIVSLEQEADERKKEIRQHLPKSLFMPVPREDLLALLLVQDKIANRARDVSGLVLGRRMKFPPPLDEQFLEFVQRNVDAAKMARKSVRELDELFTTGFRGAEAQLVESMVDKLDEIETDTDRRQAELRSALYAIESELSPVDVMFMYRAIELTGEVADMADRVGRRLELLLAH